MKSSKATVPLLLLPLFFLLQIMVVPHLHIDEQGETHAHSHVVAEHTDHENIDSVEHATQGTHQGHDHSHDEMHGNAVDDLFHRLGIQFNTVSTPSFAPVVKFARYACEPKFDRFHLGQNSYLRSIVKKGHLHALIEHIDRMLSVRLTT